MISLSKFFKNIQTRGKMKVVVSVDEDYLNHLKMQVLEEAKKEKVGKYTAYRHSPHFRGGEYHGHCDLEDGYQISYTITHQRLHPNKFPADHKIPKKAKMAIAKVLGVSVDLLEGYVTYDDSEHTEVVLFELNKRSQAALLLERINSFIKK